jgi:hypothetical protein
MSKTYRRNSYKDENDTKGKRISKRREGTHDEVEEHMSAEIRRPRPAFPRGRNLGEGHYAHLFGTAGGF